MRGTCQGKDGMGWDGIRDREQKYGLEITKNRQGTAKTNVWNKGMVIKLAFFTPMFAISSKPHTIFSIAINRTYSYPKYI